MKTEETKVHGIIALLRVHFVSWLWLFSWWTMHEAPKNIFFQEETILKTQQQQQINKPNGTVISMAKVVHLHV